MLRLKNEREGKILGKIRLASFMIGCSYWASVEDNNVYIIYYVEGIRFKIEMTVVEVEELDFVSLYYVLEDKLDKMIDRYKEDVIRYKKGCKRYKYEKI